ncbi:hypothetical protein BH24CHL5_BH24CHL5_01430 [soil metagenome]
MVTASAKSVRVDLAFEPQLDLGATLAPLGRWGDDLIDRWDGSVLVRTLRTGPDGRVVPFAARERASPEWTTLELALPPRLASDADGLARLVAATFVTDTAALDALARSDERISRLVSAHPGVVPVLVPDPFTALIRSISAQQVNLRWAATIRRRLAERYGRSHDVDGWQVMSLDPLALIDAKFDDLRALQLTGAKARSVIACAQAARAGLLEMSALERMTDDELIEHLTGLPGIGRWSAEWFLARTLGRPRVVAGDLGVRKAVGRLYDASRLPAEEEVRRLTAHWGAAATVAQALALHDLAVADGVA